MMRVEKASSFRELCFVLYVFVKRIERDERGVDVVEIEVGSGSAGVRESY